MLKKSKSGGYRPGSGRPKGTGKYREPTEPLRVPRSLLSQVKDLLAYYLETGHNTIEDGNYRYESRSANYAELNSTTAFPLFATKVAAGFPSPADDHIEASLDLNQHLVKHPAATFFVRVEGESMLGAGIYPNDILVVDRSLKPANGKVVIAVVNGELTVKRLKVGKGTLTLLAENIQYPSIEITEDMNFSIWGVVTNVIHAV
jgi:DNA polymerase V